MLAEIGESRPLTAEEQALAARIGDRLATKTATRGEASLYDGVAGDATALAMLAPERARAALRRLEELMTPDGWPTTLELEATGGCLTDIVIGAVGVVLAAMWVGGEDSACTALTGCEALLRAADRTGAGWDWGMWPGAKSRGPNYSHGTAGIASALAVAGAAFDRPALVKAGSPRAGTSWMQGAAGIAAFLLRLARVLVDGLDAPVVDRPDQWWAVSAGVRRSGRLPWNVDPPRTPLVTPGAPPPRRHER